MRGNGAVETHVGKVQGGDSLSASTARDPKPLTEVCCCWPVTSSSEGSIVWSKSDFRFEGNKSWLISKVVGRLGHVRYAWLH